MITNCPTCGTHCELTGDVFVETVNYQPVGQYTADENALIAETLGHLISLMEGLCEQVTVDRLRALRTKAASLAFNEIAGT